MKRNFFEKLPRTKENQGVLENNEVLRNYLEAEPGKTLVELIFWKIGSNKSEKSISALVQQ